MPGPLIAPDSESSAAASGVTRAQYRAAVAGEIGHFRSLTVSARASSSVTPDANRQIICTALRSDNVPTGRYDGHWVYVPSTDETRRVLEGTYDGADASLLLDDPLTAPLAAGTAVELTNTLPGSWYADLRGLNQIVNDALERLPVWARVEIEGDGSRSYALGDYPWMLEDSISHLETRWHGSVTPAATDPTMPSPYGFRTQRDGASLSLITDAAYPSGNAFTVVAIRPGNAWIRSGGTWVAGNGLENEDDEAAAPLRWVRIWGAVLAYRHLIEVTDEDETLTEERRARRIERYNRRIMMYGPTLREIILHELPRRQGATRSLHTGPLGGHGSYGAGYPAPVGWP